MLFLALSCLQGRPMAAAFDELRTLAPDGIQLTPGNLPTRHFSAHVAFSKVKIRTHHGFSWTKRRRPVWNATDCLTQVDSVHPPLRASMDERAWSRWIERASCTLRGAALDIPALEIMPPRHRLGDDAELCDAMARGLRLALDLSHLAIQREQDRITAHTLRRLLAYPLVAEVHISRSDGLRDRHLPLTPRTYGLGFAREWLRAGRPLILEAYMHALSVRERAQQLDLLRS